MQRPPDSDPPLQLPQERDPHDTYMRLFCRMLAGYALLGKGFAYLGIPPLFVGEIALGFGLRALLRSGCSLAMLATVPSLLLATLSTLVIAEAVASVPAYGVDAIRDSVILLYGLFAFIVIALVLEKPDRLNWTLRAYGRFAWLYGMIGGVIFNLSSIFADNLYASGLYFPGTNIVLPYVRAGEAASHLSGAAVFMLLGFCRVPLSWVLLLLVNIFMVTPSRGAMFSCVIPIGIAAVLADRMRRIAPVLLLSAALFVVAYAIGLEVPLSGGRYIGPAQIVENFNSIFGASDASNLDATKTWRLSWWQAIRNYTFNGPYFWTGKGYGISLAEADGFADHVAGQAILRSPHNAHMTMLARSGVPGLALWVLTGVAWFTGLLHAQIVARCRGDTQWANLFLWVACYALAIVIDASFDVALEGPMLGIWFWSLFGLGIASTMVYRVRLGIGGAGAAAAFTFELRAAPVNAVRVRAADQRRP
ncbi:O-antigen ligase family protein [Bradyrhizobium sp.]|uniref:O-antigen ligase family protein n=1 Tax=Bradyrhizobium sp. TaxID=376 RepID=UPI001ED14DC0|nr:O-antigen ligase family protein [Bradyrhizobium sp.]MBV9982350.1 O-antigen ligase family protein [Bradyrhizobium sp.]